MCYDAKSVVQSASLSLHIGLQFYSINAVFYY